MTPQSLAQEVSSIFSLPEVAIRLNEIIDEPDTTAHDLEEIIVHDPALTANILKLVNSAFFGIQPNIGTVSRAITLLGYQEIRNLVLATSVTSAFEGISEELVNMETFWYHSVCCGIVAKTLAKHCRIAEADRFFTAGLLHGIGKLIFYAHYPQHSVEILAEMDNGEDAMVAVEREIFGFSYADAGAELLKYWKLPPAICQMVEGHLEPCQQAQLNRDTSILHVASKIANKIGPTLKVDTETPENCFSFAPVIWNTVELSCELIDSILADAPRQSSEIMQIIKPECALTA